MRPRVTLSWIVTILLQSCAGGSSGRAEVELNEPVDWTIRDLVERSPNVIVGVVQATDHGEQQRVANRFGANLFVREVIVKARVEECLRGRCPDDAIVTFRYFEYAGSEQGYTAPPPMRLLPSQRRIFFLAEGSPWRSLCDIQDCTIQVYSGRHVSGMKTSVGARIAEILLSPGSGVVKETFLANLSMNHSIGVSVSSARFALVLLLDLQKEEQFKGPACEETVSHYPGQSDCLRELSASREAFTRLNRLENARNSSIRQRITLLEGGQEFESLPSSGKRSECEGLEILLFHRDRSLALAASSLYRNLCLRWEAIAR